MMGSEQLPSSLDVSFQAFFTESGSSLEGAEAQLGWVLVKLLAGDRGVRAPHG